MSFFQEIDNERGKIQRGIKRQMEGHDISENGRVEISKADTSKKQHINWGKCQNQLYRSSGNEFEVSNNQENV